MAKSTGSTPSVSFPKGGNGKMFSRQHAGPQVAGTTAHSTSGDGGKFPGGGSKKMFGQGHANAAVAGATAKASQ